MNTWLHRDVARLGRPIHRVGIACNFGLEPAAFEHAIAAGINYVFWTPKMRAITPTLKALLKADRERIILSTGPTFSFFGGSLRKGTEHILKTLDIDYIDILQQFWLGKMGAETEATAETLQELKQSGKVRLIGTSIHDRPRAGQLARDRVYDMLMIRYNAAHPGAESDIFPHVSPNHTMVTSYTATNWRRLLKTHRKWDGPIPNAADCYRFALSRAEVDVTLMGVASMEQFDANLKGLEKGPMNSDELKWMRDFGAVVHG